MSDGNETDSSRRQPEVSAVLGAQLDEIADTVNVVAKVVADLDHRIQSSQAATAANDHRWEQRITTMESDLAELGAAVRSETERAGTAMQATDVAGEFEALRHRLDDVHQDLSGLAVSLTAVQHETVLLREGQAHPEAVVAALDRIADLQPDFGPLLTAMQRIPGALPDFAEMIESLTASGTDLASMHHELLALRSSQPDLTPVLTALQDLRDRQVDLTPVFEELRELRSSQPDVASVVDAIDALGASLPSKLLELERRFPDVSELATSLERIHAQRTDLQPVIEAIEALASPDFTPLLDAIAEGPSETDLTPVVEELRALRTDQTQLLRRTESLDAPHNEAPDLDPVFDTLAELSSNLADSLQHRVEALLTAAMNRQHLATEATQVRLRELDDLVSPVAGALQTLSERLDGISSALDAADSARQAERSDLTSRLSAIREDLVAAAADVVSNPAAALDGRLEDVLRDWVDDIDRAVAARQFEHRTTIAELIDSIPDSSAAVDALTLSLAERGSTAAAPTDLLARLDALAERTDTSLQAVRESIEDRLSILEESRSADAASIREGVEQLESSERLVADRLEAISQQLATARADSVASGHSAALESIASSHRELVEAEQTDRAALAGISRQLDELLGSTETVDRAVSALASRAGSVDDPMLVEAIEPLARAVDALSELSSDHRARLDAIGRSVEAFADAGPRIDEVHRSLDQRIEALLDRQAHVLSSVRELHPRFDALDAHDPREGLGEVLHRFSLAEADLGAIGPKLEGLVGALERTDLHVADQAEVLDRVEFMRAEVGEAASKVIDRIDTLDDTVVGRLDDNQVRTDHLTTQVSSIHAFTSSGPSGIEIRTHVDVALAGLAERIGNALRDLRREVTGLGAATDTSGLTATFEASIDRLTSRLDADIARVLDALSSGDDSDRLRRIDGAIAEIRRDFEVLRRLSDQPLPPNPD